MGNIGSSELLLIFLLALLLLGPKRLPELGEMLGRTIRRFRSASRELRDELDVRGDLDFRRDFDRRRDLDPEAPRVAPARDAQPREPGPRDPEPAPNRASEN